MRRRPSPRSAAAGSQAVRQAVPETEQPRVGHLEDAADIRGLAFVEEEVAVGRVRICVAIALQEPERHEGIEEIARRPGVQAQLRAQLLRARRRSRQLREQLELDSAEQGFRRPEPESRLQDAFGAGSLRS